MKIIPETYVFTEDETAHAVVGFVDITRKGQTVDKKKGGPKASFQELYSMTLN